MSKTIRVLTRKGKIVSRRAIVRNLPGDYEEIAQVGIYLYRVVEEDGQGFIYSSRGY